MNAVVQPHEMAIANAAALYERRRTLQIMFGDHYKARLEKAIERLREHIKLLESDNAVSAAIDYCKVLNSVDMDFMDRETAKQFVLVAAIEIAEGTA